MPPKRGGSAGAPFTNRAPEPPNSASTTDRDPRSRRVKSRAPVPVQRTTTRGAAQRRYLQVEETNLRAELAAQEGKEAAGMEHQRRGELERVKAAILERVTAELAALREESAATIADLRSDRAAVWQAVSSFAEDLTPTVATDLPERIRGGERPVRELRLYGAEVARVVAADHATTVKANSERISCADELAETKQVLCGAQQLINARLTNAPTDNSRAAELFRAQAEGFEQRMAAMEDNFRTATDAVLAQAGDALYDGFACPGSDLNPGRSPLARPPRETVRERLLTAAENTRFAQATLLLDVRAEIGQRLAAHRQQWLDPVRAGRSGLSAAARRTLADERVVSREMLLRMLDELALDPAVGALIQAEVDGVAVPDAHTAPVSVAPAELLRGHPTVTAPRPPPRQGRANAHPMLRAPNQRHVGQPCGPVSGPVGFLRDRADEVRRPKAWAPETARPEAGRYTRSLTAAEVEAQRTQKQLREVALIAKGIAGLPPPV